MVVSCNVGLESIYLVEKDMLGSVCWTEKKLDRERDRKMPE